MTVDECLNVGVDIRVRVNHRMADPGLPAVRVQVQALSCSSAVEERPRGVAEFDIRNCGDFPLGVTKRFRPYQPVDGHKAIQGPSFSLRSGPPLISVGSCCGKPLRKSTLLLSARTRSSQLCCSRMASPLPKARHLSRYARSFRVSSWIAAGISEG